MTDRPSGRQPKKKPDAKAASGERSIDLNAFLLANAKKRVAETTPLAGQPIEKAPEHDLTPTPVDAPASATVASPRADEKKAARPRRLRVRLLATCLSILVGVVVVEVATRLTIAEHPRIRGKALGTHAFCESLEYPTLREPPAPPYQLDPQLGFCLMPELDMKVPFPEAPGGQYSIVTNRAGLRDPRTLATGPEGHALRILVVGDSMTFGPGVEQKEAFPAVLERELGSRLGIPLEVVNCGVCSWGQQEECAFLEHRGTRLSPALVVLQFTPANDVLDNLRCKVKDGLLVPDPDVAQELAKHWMFELPFAETSHAWRLFTWSFGRHVVRYEIMKDPARLAKASDLVRRARDICQAANARMVLALAPTLVQVESSLTESVLGTKKINEAIAARAKADGIPVFDPTLPLARAHRTANKPYFAKDMHWNANGHQVVGAALAEWLEPQIKQP